MRLCANTTKVSFVFYLTPYIVLKVKLAHTKNPVKIPSVEAKGVELTQNIICGWKVQKPIHIWTTVISSYVREPEGPWCEIYHAIIGAMRFYLSDRTVVVESKFVEYVHYIAFLILTYSCD
jgi:hypothetical protein